MSIDCEQPSIPDTDDEPPGDLITLVRLSPTSHHEPSVPPSTHPPSPVPNQSPSSLPVLDYYDRHRETHHSDLDSHASCSSLEPSNSLVFLQPAFASPALLSPSLSLAAATLSTAILPASRTSDVQLSSHDAGLSFTPLKTDLFGHPLEEHRGPSRNRKPARRATGNPSKNGTGKPAGPSNKGNPIRSVPAIPTAPVEEATVVVRPVKRLVDREGAGTVRRSRSNPRTKAFRKAFFPDVTDRDWNDWRWQSRHRVRNLQQLEKMLVLSDDEREALVKAASMLPVGITPYYMSLLDREDANQPLRRTVIPVTNEFTRTVGEADDPLGEDGHSPVPGLVHRYPDRVLLLALDFCSTYCRYCTRSRVVGHGEIAPKEERLQKIFDYLRKTPQVRDVLISGGDPLAMAEDKIDYILKNLRAIPHIEFVRIGTKMPAVLPQRITPQLTRVLRKYHPLWMSVHFLHGDECTPESNQACSRLADAGIPLGAQTVLLKGVNDNVPAMKELVHKLLLQRVRPYYLYQCDPISGSSHFRTSVSKGLEIIEGLRGHTTGYAVPTYVIDAPGGGGKIPLQPNYLIGRDGDNVVIRNFEGKEYRYPDPVGFDALPSGMVVAPSL